MVARLWTELRSELVADGRLDERRVAVAKDHLLARLRAHEIAEAGEASDAVPEARKVPGTKNGKTTSESLVALATQVMQDPRASKIQKSLAASALSQRDPSHETSAETERKAAMVLSGKRYAEVTRTLAASVMDQACKGC